MEIVSGINDTEEIPEGTFTINFKLIKKYQYREPWLIYKYKIFTYHKGSLMEEVIYILTL